MQLQFLAPVDFLKSSWTVAVFDPGGFVYLQILRARFVMSTFFLLRRARSTIVEGQRLQQFGHHGWFLFQTAFSLRSEQNGWHGHVYAYVCFHVHVHMYMYACEYAYLYIYTVIWQRLQHTCQHPEDGKASWRRAASLSISSFSVFVSLCVCLRVFCVMLCFVCCVLCVSVCVSVFLVVFGVSAMKVSECLDMCTCDTQWSWQWWTMLEKGKVRGDSGGGTQRYWRANRSLYFVFGWRKTNRTILQLVPSAVPFKTHHTPHRTHTPHHNTKHNTKHNTTQHNTTQHDTTHHTTTTTRPQHHTETERDRQRRQTEREERRFQCGGAWPFFVDGVLFLVNPVLRPRLEPAKQCQVRLFFDFFQCILAGWQFFWILRIIQTMQLQFSIFYFFELSTYAVTVSKIFEL